MYGEKSFYRDYENLLIKNDELSKENRNLKYTQLLLEKQNNNLRKIEKQLKNKVKELEEEHQNLLKEKDFEIARLKALLNMDGTNHGIPTSQTPINKKKVIPNTREKSNKAKGGQIGHKKHKLEKFKDEEINEEVEHSMEKCPCCSSQAIKKTGEIKEKDELDYKIVVVKRRHKFVEYECEECGKKFHEEIPNNLKEENQYGPQVQALELTLMNQANVTINKAQKITKGLTNGEIDLSEGYIAKLQKRASDKLSNFMEEMKTEIIKQPLLHWDDTLLSAVDVTAGLKEDGAILINTIKTIDEIRPLLKGYKGKVYTIDARKISEEALGKYFPNTPMLAAIVKVTGIMTDEDFIKDMQESFKHKFAKKPEVIPGNMKAVEIALKEVKKVQ